MKISLGALAPSLTEQLAGSTIQADKLEHFDADADAISRLHVRGLISDSQATAARKRLVNAIQKAARIGST